MIAPFLHRTPASRLVFGPGAVGTLLLCALRFVFVSLPLVFFLPRPAITWRQLVTWLEDSRYTMSHGQCLEQHTGRINGDIEALDFALYQAIVE